MVYNELRLDPNMFHVQSESYREKSYNFKCEPNTFPGESLVYIGVRPALCACVFLLHKICNLWYICTREKKTYLRLERKRKYTLKITMVIIKERETLKLEGRKLVSDL